MDTIRNYLDNMFASLLRTEQIERLYRDLLATMEDKYRELKEAGRSENEAIGIVISEFGNITELLEEMDLTPAGQPQAGAEAQPRPQTPREAALPQVGLPEADAFLQARQSAGLLVGLGVLCCCLAPGLFVLFERVFPYEIPAFAGLFGLVAVGVALFILSGSRLERFQYIKEQQFRLAPDAEVMVRDGRAESARTRTRLLIAGIVLCILSPVGFGWLPNMNYSIGGELAILLLLFLAGAGVLLIILSDGVFGGYPQLLKEGDPVRSKPTGRAGKYTAALAAVWWPVVTCIYLLYSFLTFNWHFSWIIWPVAAILFGGVSGVIGILGGDDDED